MPVEMPDISLISDSESIYAPIQRAQGRSAAVYMLALAESERPCASASRSQRPCRQH